MGQNPAAFAGNTIKNRLHHEIHQRQLQDLSTNDFSLIPSSIDSRGRRFMICGAQVLKIWGPKMNCLSMGPETNRSKSWKARDIRKSLHNGELQTAKKRPKELSRDSWVETFSSKHKMHEIAGTSGWSIIRQMAYSQCVSEVPFLQLNLTQPCLRSLK